MIESLDIKSLSLFYFIYKDGTLTTAGRRLGLSQSAASRQLSQLEKHSRFTLFHRSQGRLIPTSEARLLFEEVKNFIAASNHIQSVISNIAEYRRGEIRIVAPSSFSEAILPKIISTYLQKYPEIHISIDNQRSETALSQIANLTADIAFLPISDPDSLYNIEPIVSRPLVCVMRADDDLAKIENLVISDLANRKFIMLGAGSSSRADIEKIFVREGARIHTSIETRSISTACALVQERLGITVVSGILAEYYMYNTLVSRDLHALPQSIYSMVTLNTVQESPLLRTFINHVRDYFSGV